MGRLFGTDGVRGKAGHAPLDPPTVRRLGAALVRALPGGHAPRRLLVGRDTRESGVWLERDLADGVHSQGATLVSAGVIPTPAVAYLARENTFDAGIVISASHNPFEDNGIKVFSGTGEKFTERVEAEVETIMRDPSWTVPEVPGPVVEQADYSSDYIGYLRQVLPDASALRPMRIAVDCANGATVAIAPRLFEGLGLDVTCVACEPNGRNINLDCGSTHPERLAAVVRQDGFRLGVAFDGDGDRAIFVDAAGGIVDGDAVMLMCARQLQDDGRLRGNAIVATVMSNIGLELALRSRGIDLVRCPVGDKHVMEEMIRRDLSLGGEQSGHIILSEHLYTGDGLATALAVLRAMAQTGRELRDLALELVTYPQVLLNVRVREKKNLSDVPAVAAAIAAVEARLAGQGRLLVRYSGTEPLLRVMLEGRDPDEIRRWGEEIVAVVRSELA